MITTTPSPARNRSRLRRGFSLVELMVSSTFGGILLIAALTGFLFIGRTGANMRNYTDMERQARKAIETFAADVRMAKGATWNSENSLTLTVVTAAGLTQNYTYTYNPDAGTFQRVANGTTTPLLTGVTAFTFTAYKINTEPIDLSNPATLASASNLTKQVQISLRTIRRTITVTDATNSVISARFILRNKRVTA